METARLDRAAPFATCAASWHTGDVPLLTARVHRWLELLVVGGVLFGVFMRGIDAVPFHVDESQWIATSNAFEAFVHGEWTSPVWRESYWTLGQPPLTRYLIGLGRRAGGYHASDLNPAWKFSESEAANLAAGAKPSPGLLFWSRLVMAVLSAAAAMLLFALVQAYAGRGAGYAFVLLFAWNGYLLVHLRRAMSEAPLFACVALSMFATCRALERYERSPDLHDPAAPIRGLVLWTALSAVCAGLAGSAKLNGLLLAVPAAGIPMIALVKDRRHEGAVAALAVFFLTFAVACGVFVLINPFLYDDPVGRTLEMLSFRGLEMERQLQRFPQYQFPDMRTHISVVLQRLFHDDTFPHSQLGLIVNPVLCAIGCGVLVGRTRRWLSGDAAESASAVLLGTAAIMVPPALLTPLDWDRYYLLPVVFIAVCVAVGVGSTVAHVRRWTSPQCHGRAHWRRLTASRCRRRVPHDPAAMD